MGAGIFTSTPGIGDNSATADLIEKAGTSLIRNAQFALLAKWLDALPVENPGLTPQPDIP